MLRTLVLLLLSAVSSSALSAQPFEARGRVLGTDGEVPREVRVELWRAVPAIERNRADLGERPPLEPVDRAQMESDGSFVILAADPGPWVLRVSAPGRIAVERSPFLLRDLRVLDTAILPPAEDFEVVVRDPAGRPVAGAWLEVRPAEVWHQHKERFFAPARRRAVTGDQGRARLSRAVGEEVLVRALRPGGPESQEVGISGGEPPEEPLELVLPHGIQRSLVVRDDDGRPAAGFGVRVGEWSWPAAVTDEEGKAQVTLSPGEAQVEIASPAGWQVGLPLVEPAAGEPVVVSLPSPVEITGVVLDRRTTEPLPGAWVWRGESFQKAVDTAVTTDRAGRFRLEVEPVGEVRLLAVAVGYQPWWWDRKVAEGRIEGLKLALPPELIVQGRVLDPQGRPVAEADVRVRSASRRRQSWEPGRRVLQVATGPEGRFRISAEAAEMVDLRVEAEGFAPTELRRAEEELTEPLDIVLRRGAAVAGRAVDPDGAPLPGVAVRLFEEVEGGFSDWVPREQRDLARETVTGDDGRFLARHLAPGAYDLELRLEGRAPRLLPGVEPPEELEEGAALDLGDVVLEPGTALEGRVVDADGAPVSDAEVRLDHSAPPPGFELENRETTTDAEGRFRLEDLQPGEPVTVLVDASGFLPARAPEVVPPTEEPIEIRLETGVRLFGRVLDPEGAGVVDAQVRVGIQREGNSWEGSIVPQVETDREGSFEFDALHRGEVVLEVVAKGFIPATVKGWSTASSRDVGPVEVRLEPGATVTGRVLDPVGAPTPGVRVRARYWYEDGERERWVFRGWATSGRGGRFEVTGLPAGKTELQALQGDLEAKREIELRPEGAEVDLVLEPARGVLGRVVDPEGRPVAGAQIAIHPVGEPTGPRYQSATADVLGRFRLEVEPGDYRLDAHAEGFAHTVLEPLQVGEEPRRNLEIRLRAGAAVYGRITGVEPDELTRVWLSTYIEPGREWIRGRPSFDGRYRLVGLRPGVWTLVAGIDGRSIRRTVEIVGEEDVIEVDLHFPQGLTLTGIVLRNGSPLVGASLRLASTEGPPWTSIPSASTGYEGRFRLRGLEPGVYRLHVQDRQSGWRTEREVELSSDREIRVEGWATRVTGQLVDALGEPVANVRVTLRPLTGSGVEFFSPTAASTRADGRFVLPSVEEGTWRLSAAAGERGSLVTEVTVSGAEMDLGRLELETGGGFWLEPRLASGRVPSGVHVALMHPGEGPPVLQKYLQVEQDGRAHLAAIPSGSWRLMVSVEGSVPVVLPVEGSTVSGQTIPVLLEPMTELLIEVPELVASGSDARATVRDSQGEPFDFFGLAVVDVATGWPLVEGRLRMPWLPAGLWTVEVTTEDGRAWTGTVVTQPEQPAKLVLE